MTHDLKDAVVLAYGARFAVLKMLATDLKGKEAKKDVGGTSGTIMDDKTDKEENKIGSSTTGSTNSTEASNWKITAASVL